MRCRKASKVYKLFFWYKWLQFEAQAERNEARALKEPRVPREVICTPMKLFTPNTSDTPSIEMSFFTQNGIFEV